VDISHLFNLSDGDKAFVTIFPKMKGLFGTEVQPNKDFGEDVFEKSMLITGIPREHHYHSDEIEQYAARKRSPYPCTLPIDKEKHAQISTIVNQGPQDAFIVVAGPERKAMHALKKIVERTKMALDGVPQETRRFLPNGNSEFLRVIHGKERIYPDTDTPPIVISKETLDECRKQVSKRPWEIYEGLHAKYNFNQHQVDMLIRAEKTEKLREYTEELQLNGHTAYRLLIELPRREKREDTQYTDQTCQKLAEALSRKLIIPEQTDPLIEIFAKEPNLTIQEALAKLHISHVPDEKLNKLILRQLNKSDRAKLLTDETYRKHMLPKMVGEILKAVNHSVEGKKILEKIQAMIK
jgi:glutamyl-tRNA(Gln) amidotransferase subunit E